MTADRRLFRQSLAEAVALLLARKYLTTKKMARGVGIDPSTAENLNKGNLSVVTLASILLAEGREFYQALGDEIYGESFSDFEERRLTQIIKEANDARENIRSLAARREAVESRARDAVADFDRSFADRDGGEPSGVRNPASGPRHRPARPADHEAEG